MTWTPSILWLLCLSVCECSRLPRSKPAMHGEVQSPQYPEPYPASVLQQWDLSVPEGYQVQLSFTHLDIEASVHCYYDSLTVLYDQKILGKFCGPENSANGHHPGNQPILSPGNRLSLIFQTDDSNPEHHRHIGFSAHYQAIDVDECSAVVEPEADSGPLCSQLCHNTLGSYLCSCRHGYELRPDQRTCVLSCGGGIFDEPEGTLSSPGFPGHSPNGLSCQYVISVELGFTVTLNFTDSFHIESIDTPQGPSCLYHWLQVSVPGREPVKLCGGESPALMPTSSNTVQLDYHSDWAGLSRGWSLHYTTQRVECASPSSLANGRVTPNFPQYFYRDYIQARCNQGYKLMMDGREIQSYSSMCQSSGQWHLSLPECHIIDCGEPQPLLNGGVTFLSGSNNQYDSAIQYHCDERFYSLLGGGNVSYTCAADRKWRNNYDIPDAPTCIPVCGQPTELISGYQRILGGNKAPENTIPWQVMLVVNGDRAGGMVIADRWVMTAAHNLVHQGILVQKSVVKVLMGSNDAVKLTSPLNSPSEITSLHPHPLYNNPDRINYNHDIALIRLQHSVTFHAAIMPVCLPATRTATMSIGVTGLVSGFGVDGDTITNELRYVRLPVVGQGTCATSITDERKKTSGIPSLTENMFCAGKPEGGKDSCQGDSGGPYVLWDGQRFWAAGIVSWGVGCGKPHRYGVYTRVANYLDWINKTMKENK